MFAWSWVYRAFSPFHARETRNMEPIREFAELVLKSAVGGNPGDAEAIASSNSSGRDEVPVMEGKGGVRREEKASSVSCSRGGCCGSSVELGTANGQGGCDGAIKEDGRDSGDGDGSQEEAAAGLLIGKKSDPCGAAEGSERDKGNGDEARVSVVGRGAARGDGSDNGSGGDGGESSKTSLSLDCPAVEDAANVGRGREAEGGGGGVGRGKADAVVRENVRGGGGGGGGDGGGGTVSSVGSKAEERKGGARTALSDMAGRESHQAYPGSMVDEV